MQAMKVWGVTLLGAVAICTARPAGALAQGHPIQQAVVVLRANVPSVVKYVVDETVRGIDGAPTIRVLSNDRAIRAAYAQGVAPERVPSHVASWSPESSGHAKGGEPLEPLPEGAMLLRYTVVAP